MIEEITLDTRELEAPQPMQLVMENLPKLDTNSYIKMIHRIEPKMLYPHLEKNNFKYKTKFILDDIYIYIWNSSFNENDILE